MNEMLLMVLAFIAGIVLGILFFYGLWLTVRKALNSKMPALWFLGSFLVRTGIALGGFYFVSMGNWQRLLICLAGFITGRFIVNYFKRQKSENQIQLKKEVGHEA
jgi:F1F0 ATPase subunit 2